MPAVFSTNPLEKFFGNAKQRKGGNFYIVIIDVIAAAKAQHLHQLVKHNILPDANIESKRNCLICEANIEDDDVNLIDGLYITPTQTLLESDDTLKHKVVYIARLLARRYEQAETDEVLSTGFLDELNRGGPFNAYFGNSLFRSLCCNTSGNDTRTTSTLWKILSEASCIN